MLDIDAFDDATDAGNDQSMFVLIKLEKAKEKRLKFSQGSVTALKILANYQVARVKLINAQLKKKKNLQQKGKTKTILRINKKKLYDAELSHELYLTRRQTTKIRNALANNMWTDIKLSKAKISKLI